MDPRNVMRSHVRLLIMLYVPLVCVHTIRMCSCYLPFNCLLAIFLFVASSLKNYHCFQLGEIADELAKHLLTSSAYRRLLVSLLLSRATRAWLSTPLPPAINVLAERLIQQLEETGTDILSFFPPNI